MFSSVLDPSPTVNAGSTPLQPTTKAEFRAHHGKKSAAQKYLGSLGRQMDQANGQDMIKVTPRYQPHNCLPWRSDHCVSHSQPSQITNHLAPTVRPPATQCQQFNPSASSPRHITPTIPPTQQWQPFIPGAFPNGSLFPNANSRPLQWQPVNPGASLPGGLAPTIPPTRQVQSFMSGALPISNPAPIASYGAAQKQPINPSPSAPRTVEAVVERIQHLLLHYFCEGDGRTATKQQKREHAVSVLKEQLQKPIILGVAHRDTEQCEEFSRLEKAVEGCLEIMHVSDVTLVPELSDDERKLVIHVFS